MIARYRVKIPSPLLSYTLGHDEVIVTLPELSPDHAPPLRAIVAALGVLVFGNGGIQANLYDKARKLGIPARLYEGGA